MCPQKNVPRAQLKHLSHQVFASLLYCVSLNVLFIDPATQRVCATESRVHLRALPAKLGSTFPTCGATQGGGLALADTCSQAQGLQN